MEKFNSKCGFETAEELGKCGDHKDLKFSEADTKDYDLGDFSISRVKNKESNSYRSQPRKQYSKRNKNRKPKINPFLTAEACKRSDDVLTEIRLYKEQSVKKNNVYDEFMVHSFII